MPNDRGRRDFTEGGYDRDEIFLKNINICKNINWFEIHLNLSILGTPGSGNIAGIARNKRNSVINTGLNCHSKLSYNSNLMWHSHSGCEGKLG